MNLNSYGLACDASVRATMSSAKTAAIDAFIVMPNHVHLLVVVKTRDAVEYRSVVSRTVGSVKAGASRRLRELGFVGKVWQAGFYDHIVRDEKDYERIYTYIENNPSKWLTDRYNE